MHSALYFILTIITFATLATMTIPSLNGLQIEVLREGKGTKETKRGE